MFFPNPFWKPLLEGPSARLSSKLRFGTDFRFSQDLETEPWNDIFGHKGIKRVPWQILGSAWSDLDAIWRRKRSKNIMCLDLGSFFDWFLKDCWLFSHGFPMKFNRFWMPLLAEFCHSLFDTFFKKMINSRAKFLRVVVNVTRGGGNAALPRYR